MKVIRHDSAATARDFSRDYLSRDPLLNTLVLTLLESRVLDSLSGRYWTAFEDGQAAGIGIQTPLDRPIVLSTMSEHVADALAHSIGTGGEEVPGAWGEVRAVSRFAGEWAACRKVAAHPTAARRLYEARAIRDGGTSHGLPEKARSEHDGLAHDWITAFSKEIDEPPEELEVIRQRIDAGQVWLWSDGDFRSLAVISAPAFGGTRFRCVYTPPEHRRKGYAESLVRSMTGRLLGEGLRPMLFTDLADPGANSLYQRIGYEAAAEMLLYRFDPSRPRRLK